MKRLTKIRKTATDNDNPYAKINIQAIYHAMLDLASERGAFTLWVWFAMKSDGHIFVLDNDWARQQTGLYKKQYERAKTLLKEKGYLVEFPESKMLFIDWPQ